MDIKSFSKIYRVRVLTNEDIGSILNIMENNPLYFMHCPPNPTTLLIKEDMNALPPNKNKEDKYYIGYFSNDDLLCVMDIIDKYPNDYTAFIGFFMMNKNYQGKGIGSSIIEELSLYLKKKMYKEIKLGYVITNKQAKSFWNKCGFVPTGDISHQDLYDVVVMSKKL